jgi:hypothetical protein
MYEFLTPWHALNQQNAKKFYDLKGKTGRDAFMQRILTGHLNALVKSVDYEVLSAVSCVAKVRFKRERIHHENVMVFMGKFQTNIRIPDYIGIGQLVSQGFGTIKRLIEDPGQDYEVNEHEAHITGDRCPERIFHEQATGDPCSSGFPLF